MLRNGLHGLDYAVAACDKEPQGGILGRCHGVGKYLRAFSCYLKARVAEHAKPKVGRNTASQKSADG